VEYVVIAIVAVAALLFVSYPLIGKPRKLYDIESASDSGDAATINHLRLKKARVEENLRELEFEHEMGKLSEHDYAALREGYAKEIDELSRSLDAHRVKEDTENLIENEVRTRRRIK
jgi:hypothetical protein